MKRFCRNMKFLTLIIFCLFLLYSCKENNKVNNDIKLIENLYQIKTIKGRSEVEDEKVKVEFYKSVSGSNILNQSYFYHKEVLDSLKSKFYTLDYQKKVEYSGKIFFNFKSKKFSNVDLFLQIVENNIKKEISFESKNLEEVKFNFTNEDTINPIKRVLRFQIIDSMIVENKMIEGYYYEYLFIDSNEFTDNPYVKKYKN